jgi:hypothetical protein
LLRITRFAFAAATVAASCAAGFAQDARQGIAFAYAPEQSSGFCIGGSPERTLACAREKCVAGGAAAADCARVAWCFPMGWSVEIGIMHKEGIHWSEYTCGWASKESAAAAAKVRCDAALREYVQDCSVGRFWDEDGNVIEAE